MLRTMNTIVEFLARYTALAGGLVLIAVVLMACVSIAGRAMIGIGFGPVPGDFELVEIGVGFAVFCFLPWCQIKGGHARVDLFKPVFGNAFNRFIDIVANLLMLIVAFLIAWRLWLGMLDKKSYLETTFILQFPVWIAYAAGLVGAVVFVVVSAYCLLRTLYDSAERQS